MGAAIPAQAAGTTVYYYVEGNAVSGKTQVRPIAAPAGYWKFNVLLNTSITTLAENHASITAVYPNPSRGITCIETTLPNEAKVRVSVKNILGEVVEEIFNGVASGDKKFFANTSDYPDGVYFVQVVYGEQVVNRKFVVGF
ncbi:MAG: T9SS type A sorting domain-containing protein [Bacteroidetes bacterium]|nr:T9SS type A sorting domain-containing protein [Bacteroidota bacterium]